MCKMMEEYRVMLRSVFPKYAVTVEPYDFKIIIIIIYHCLLYSG